MYNTSDIQAMIDKVNNDDKVNEVVDLISDEDWQKVSRVLRTGFAEDFDRYDSDVCESFICAYEHVYGTKGGN